MCSVTVNAVSELLHSCLSLDGFYVRMWVWGDVGQTPFKIIAYWQSKIT